MAHGKKNVTINLTQEQFEQLVSKSVAAAVAAAAPPPTPMPFKTTIAMLVMLMILIAGSAELASLTHQSVLDGFAGVAGLYALVAYVMAAPRWRKR